MRRIRIKIRIIFIIAAALILAWLLDRNFLLSWPLEITYDFSRPDGLVSLLKPTERVSSIKKEQGKFFQTIEREPVFFELNFPFSFSKTAEVVLDYHNPAQEIVELGLEVARGNYYLKSLENKVLDNLRWPKICQREVCLWQREKRFSDIGDFLNNLPPLSKIGTYHYDINEPYLLADYQPAQTYQELNYSLRGSHEFYTYLKDESADFIFTLEDTNRTPGPDEIDIKIYDWQNELLFSERMIDDGILAGNEQVSPARLLTLKTPPLPEGVYKVNIKTTDDIFIRRIKSKQRYIIFRGRVYLGDALNSFFTLDKDISLITNSRQIKTVAPHSQSLQNIKIGAEELAIQEVYKQYHYLNNKNKISLFIPKGDLLLQSDGLWSFNKDKFFNPLTQKVATVKDLEDLDFIIAAYQPNQERKASFDLSRARREKGKIKFVISAPGLESAEKTIDLYQIKLKIDRRRNKN